MLDSEIKNRILEAARDYYFNQGFSKTTMDDFAQLLGMSKKTIYKYFASKDDLIKEITREKLHQIHRTCNVWHRDSSMDFIDRIKCITSYISREMQSMKPTFYLDIQRNMPELWKEIDAFRQEKVFIDFGMMVGEGIKLGVFRKDVNVEVLVLLYSASMQTIINPETLATLPLTASQAYESIADIIFNGIFTTGAKEKYNTHAAIIEKENI